MGERKIGSVQMAYLTQPYAGTTPPPPPLGRRSPSPASRGGFAGRPKSVAGQETDERDKGNHLKGGPRMPVKHNPELIGSARQLRKNMTAEERILWYQYLRTYPVKFYRQRAMGHYIVDFYCAKARLVVELDGAQHYDEKGLAYDRARTAYLESLGLKVLRVSNTDVKKNLRGACEFIDEAVWKAGIDPSTGLEAGPPPL